MLRPGIRVLAVACVKDGVVYSFGGGVYVGDETPPDTIRFAGMTYEEYCEGLREWSEELGIPMPTDRTNPKIELDTGEVVWGCECWWDEEERAKTNLKGLEFRKVTVDEYRRGEVASDA